MVRCRLILVFLLGLNSVRQSVMAQRPRLMAWETCSLTEGKGDSCSVGDRPLPFEQFLVPGAWANTPGDSFSGDFQWDIKQPETKHFKVTWNEVGKMTSHRIRHVRYASVNSGFADLLLAEDGNSTFIPLMKWSGQMPEAAIYRADGAEVLVISKDFGGNIPMVQTWAWIWGPNGPVRLDLGAAVGEALRRVAPGYSAYDTGLDWNTLHYETWVWKGGWPGKIGVSDSLEAWFKLGRDGLTLKRAEFRKGFGDNPRTVRWPESASPLAQDRPRTADTRTGVVTGMVVDAQDGRPVADVDVGVRNGWEVLFPGRTSADGRFRIPEVKPGTYFLGATKRGYITYYVEPIIFFEVRPGASVALATIRLTATAVVSGTVLDPWGIPIKGARASLRTRAQMLEKRFREVSNSADTDERGRFTMREVKPGRYIVEAIAANRYGGSFLVQVLTDGALEWREANYSAAYWTEPGGAAPWSEVSVGSKDTVSSLSMQLGWNIGPPVRPDLEVGDSDIHVKIVDRATRNPVSHAQVALWRLPAFRSNGSHSPIITTLADASGIVSLSGVATGEYDTYVERYGYVGASFQIRTMTRGKEPLVLEIAVANLGQ